MKKLNLKLGGIKEMLSREQMKKVVGGDGYGYSGGGSTNCYYCTDPTSGIHGSCDRRGDGTCLGAGIPTYCVC